MITQSLIIGYLVAGIAQTYLDYFEKNPLKKPKWAFSPSFGSWLVAMLIWPTGVINTYYALKGKYSNLGTIILTILPLLIDYIFYSSYTFGAQLLISNYISNALLHYFLLVIGLIVGLFIAIPLNSLIKVIITQALNNLLVYMILSGIIYGIFIYLNNIDYTWWHAAIIISFGYALKFALGKKEVY